MAKFKSSGIRIAPKVQEKRILAIAERLKKNPFLILPQCPSEDCGGCPFKNIQKKLEKVKGTVDDEKKLGKLAKKKDLASAAAGTILLTFSKKIPYLATKNIDGETVVYAQRGKASEHNLIALQHFDNPALRLLGFTHLAQKKKVYLYVTDEKTICMGKNPVPPEEFITFLSKKMGWKEERCTHEGALINIKWIPAHREIKICKKCAEGNTISKMMRYYYTPFLEDEFEAEVIGEAVKCGESCKVCKIKGAKEKKMDDSMYIQGKISDKDFIENWYKKVQWNIKKVSEGIIILDGTCYGTNADAVIKKINPSEWEETGLRYVLEKIEEPIILTNVTTNKILTAYWDKYGKDITKKIAGVDGENIYEDGKKRHDAPSQILEKAYNTQKKGKILKELPTYNELPPLAEFADRVARAYKVNGEEAALKEIHNEKMETKKKAIAYAFLLAIKKGESEAWKYSQIEKEFGRHLAPLAEKVLSGKGAGYQKALQSLIAESGSTKKVGG